MAGNRLCHSEHVHADLAGIPERFCERCLHRTPLPATLYATLANGTTEATRQHNGLTVALEKGGDTWRGERENVAVVLARTGERWDLQVTREGARLSPGKLESMQPLVLHWRTLGGSAGAVDVIVTS